MSSDDDFARIKTLVLERSMEDSIRKTARNRLPTADPQPGNGKLEIGEVWNDSVDVAAPVAPCLTQTQREIVAVCDSIKELLLAKNRAYGDSALNPVRIFSKGSPLQQIEDRIDDKLSRIARGTATQAVPEDTVRDLIGYLVLLLVARGRSGQ